MKLNEFTKSHNIQVMDIKLESKSLDSEVIVSATYDNMHFELKRCITYCIC